MSERRKRRGKGGSKFNASRDLASYAEVKERLQEFYAKHPEGAIRRIPGYPRLYEADGRAWVMHGAAAFRNMEDELPIGEGFASEPIPGKTKFTRDSEVENAETSAWGRALAAAGFKVDRSIASAEEIRARLEDDDADEDEDEDEGDGDNEPASAGQKKHLSNIIRQLKRRDDSRDWDKFVERGIRRKFDKRRSDLTSEEIEAVMDGLRKLRDDLPAEADE